MALEAEPEPLVLEFDLPGRIVRVFHSGQADAILGKLVPLGLGAKIVSSRYIDKDQFAEVLSSNSTAEKADARVLKIVLAINAVMFFVELIVGYVAQSTGLIADSLDMFADAAVYAMALYVVGRSAALKLRVAHLSGWLQILLAVGALLEVVRRFLFGSEPASDLMISIGLLAFVANVCCLLLIANNRNNGSHMKASWIFTANDVVANMGVMLAGILVATTESRYPDLIVGLVIGVIVFLGARRILMLKIDQ